MEQCLAQSAPSIRAEEAREIVLRQLQQEEKEVNAHRKLFGSGLPGFKARAPIHLIIRTVEEYDFGWVFSWNTEEYLLKGDRRECLLGPLNYLVDRTDGALFDRFDLDEWRAGRGRKRVQNRDQW